MVPDALARIRLRGAGPRQTPHFYQLIPKPCLLSLRRRAFPGPTPRASHAYAAAAVSPPPPLPPPPPPPLPPPPVEKPMIGGMKRQRYQLQPGISLPRLLILALLVSCSFPGTVSSRIVTLSSIQIFNTHEILGSKPSVYFHCKGENKTSLPDVEKTNFLYTFKGEESWQPLTELPDKKCKRCGLYEADVLTPDDVFDEWELCPGDFVNGEYVHFKEKEMNATFVCLQCTGSDNSGETSGSSRKASRRESKATLVVIICLLASVIAVVGLVVGFKYWQKRKREQDQARFLKLFEDGDDIEDELGLGHMI